MTFGLSSRPHPTLAGRVLPERTNMFGPCGQRLRELELDHAALDQLPHTDLVDQLRELLVSHQVLPSRDQPPRQRRSELVSNVRCGKA